MTQKWKKCYRPKEWVLLFITGISFKKLRQLEPLRNENLIKRFQDLAFPAYLDK